MYAPFYIIVSNPLLSFTPSTYLNCNVFFSSSFSSLLTYGQHIQKKWKQIFEYQGKDFIIITQCCCLYTLSFSIYYYINLNSVVVSFLTICSHTIHTENESEWIEASSFFPFPLKLQQQHDDIILFWDFWPLAVRFVFLSSLFSLLIPFRRTCRD